MRFIFDLGLAATEVAGQFLDRLVRHPVRVPGSRHKQNRQYGQNPLARVRLMFHVHLIAFIGHTLFLLRKLKNGLQGCLLIVEQDGHSVNGRQDANAP
jgi:hypothetical protein